MRLFVAIRLPKEMIPAVERAAAPLDGALGARVLPRESYHLTLKFLGETPNERLEEIKQALSKIKFQPFDVHLSGAGAFPSKGIPRAIWIGGESQGAGELAQKIYLFDTFEKPDKKSFAFRTVLQSFERTLEDVEANAVYDKVVHALEKTNPTWEVRK